MSEAESSLGEGNADSAVDSQGRALNALRKGAQGLAQSMQQQMGQDPGPGRSGRLGQPRAQQDTDPLGRPLRGREHTRLVAGQHATALQLPASTRDHGGAKKSAQVSSAGHASEGEHPGHLQTPSGAPLRAAPPHNKTKNLMISITTIRGPAANEKVNDFSSYTSAVFLILGTRGGLTEICG